MPRHEGHHAAVVPRYDLDAALLGRASKAGAEIIEGTAVTAAVEGDDHVEVELGGAGTAGRADGPVGTSSTGGTDGAERMRARWVVAADGMWSPMRKHLGIAESGYLGEWHAFRQYFTGVTGAAADELVILFEADLLPGYFGRSRCPATRRTSGSGIQRGGKVAVTEMKALWADLLERRHIREILGPGAEGKGVHRAWPIPARIDTMVPATKRTMFVGDAVGACDVMTGEGIGQALLSGVLAATEVIADGPRGHSAATRYGAAVRGHLVADHRMSELLVRALRHRKGARPRSGWQG
ncbi:MAG: FAD-dependent monooxygenase [Microthrixaceae bacterium]|nr:FAD-dependent monooxygenase [Microthrixaceae bacterium]